MFNNTKVKTSTDGKRTFGSVIGSKIFEKEFFKSKIAVLVESLKVLSKIARIDGQLVYTYFISNYKHKLNYILNINEHFRSYKIWTIFFK